MKTKFLRAIFLAGLFVALAGCATEEYGEDYGVSYGDDYYDPHFYDPWYAGGYYGGGGGVIISSPPHATQLPSGGGRPGPR